MTQQSHSITIKVGEYTGEDSIILNCWQTEKKEGHSQTQQQATNEDGIPY